ncbi:hypothetical protein WICPIJ_000526 [Wickerhamomyces pijperi]|uniref:Uncharacterized protein n=1 Tax=Wickerhamomyces pijperi TaxID=599730 RepID=A0A9P8TQR9_WICPI|nr:hypothetical protein WICPIJ_000526 [Wickerhamomyces pijperi]
MYIPISIADPELQKRYYYYGGGYSYGYSRPWWIALIVVGIIIFILLFLIMMRRRNFQRKSQGVQPIPYTNWTTYSWNQGTQPHQQPYNPNGYGGSKEEQLPSYQQAQYQRPSGPPPSQQQNTSTTYGDVNAFEQQQQPTGTTVIDNEYYGNSAYQPSYPQQSHTKGN